MIPFSRLYLILSSHTFQLFIAQHSLVQFLLHLVEEIGTAFVFPTFDVGIEAVAILRLNTEYLVENRASCFSGILPLLIQPISLMPYISSTRSMALPVHCKGEAVLSLVLSVDVWIGISGGTWGAARNFCIFLTKESALLM